MRSIRLAALILVVTATSCTTATSQQKETDVRRESHFERKVQCANLWKSYREDVESDAPGSPFHTFLKHIFYSPTLDTCVAAIHVTATAPLKTNVTYLLEDALTHKNIFSDNVSANPHAEQKYEAEIQRLMQ